MDSNFKKSLARVLTSEGGYVNDPHDPGGATNRGITIAVFRQFVKPNGTIEDLKNITLDQVAKVYYEKYWRKVKADQLPVGLDYAVFDFAVNSGPSRAARYLQKTLGVAPDGKIGPATLAAAAKADAAQVITALCSARMSFLMGLPTWPRFGKGWTDRVNRVRRDAITDSRSTVQVAVENWTPTPKPEPKPEPAPIPAPVQKPKPKPKPEPAPTLTLTGFIVSALAAIVKAFRK